MKFTLTLDQETLDMLISALDDSIDVTQQSLDDTPEHMEDEINDLFAYKQAQERLLKKLQSIYHQTAVPTITAEI